MNTKEISTALEDMQGVGDVIELTIAEVIRQAEKGYTQRYSADSLVRLAAVYALPARARKVLVSFGSDRCTLEDDLLKGTHLSAKSKTRVDQLLTAAALCIHEVVRLRHQTEWLREESKQSSERDFFNAWTQPRTASPDEVEPRQPIPLAEASARVIAYYQE